MSNPPISPEEMAAMAAKTLRVGIGLEAVADGATVSFTTPATGQAFSFTVVPALTEDQVREAYEWADRITEDIRQAGAIPDTQPMKASELGQYVCVARGGCRHVDRTINTDGVWVRSPDPDPLNNPGSYLYSSAHRDCYEHRTQ